MIVTDWVVRHALTAAEHQAEFTSLSSRGYRPLRIAGYELGAQPRYASVWAVQGGSDWRARHGMTVTDYQAAITAQSAEGFRPVDLSVFRSGGQVQFSVIWERDQGPEWVARHGLTAAQYQTLSDDLTTQGYRPRCVSPYEDTGGERFACLWERAAGPAWSARHGLTAAEYQVAFDTHRDQGFRLIRTVGHPSGGSIRYAAIWEKSPGHAWTAAHSVAHADFPGHVDTNRAAGLRLVDVSGVRDGTSARYTTVWEATPETAAGDAAAALVVPFMQKWAVPGLSFAVARDGVIRSARSFGYANRVTREIATPDHRFRVASVSKPITSTAVHLLIDRGQLSLTDRVFGTGALLGTTFGTQPYSARLRALTVRHLLEHSAGGWINDGADPMFQQPSLSRDALISWTLDNQPLNQDPGTTYGYSNFGYCLLGRIIERRTGLSYGEFVRSSVLTPVGAGRMLVAGATARDRAEAEAVYTGLNGASPYGQRVDRMDAHGGWAATPSDVLRFCFTVDGLPAPADLLLPATRTAMTTASAVRPITPTTAGYARGWAVNSAGTVWHNGTLTGTQAILVRPSDGRAWSAVCNAGRPGTALGGELDTLMWQVQQVV
ncbi:serine hydrolase [Streptomyces sp. NPDC057638]|uniref:serine hydrolase n=1 Tax=Streptomyces sp. NPDC057638 TaxID=3346190 RepID=UPI0036962DB3